MREGRLSFTRSWQLAAVTSLVVGAALTVPFRHLWDPDEARYAEVTREMLATGQMLVPFLFDETYAHKPPLYFWAQAALRSLGASWTAAAVVPPLLAMLATLLLLPALAHRLGLDRRAGYLAAALLASTPFAAGMALTGRMDMLLVAFHTAALFLLARLLGLGAGESPGRGVHLAFWACLALGVLTKGPVALALPLLVGVAFRLVAPVKVPLRRVLAGWGPLLCLGLVLAWLVPATIGGGAEYTSDLLIRQTADRVAPGSFGHPEPFYFHLVTYPLTGLPWSPLVIAAAISALRRRDRMATLFLAVGAVSLVALFSLVSGKLGLYLLPMFPLAALLAADRLLRGGRGNRALLLAGALAMLLIGSAVASAPFWRPELGLAPLPTVLAGAAVAVPAAFATAFARAAGAATATSVGALAASGLAFAAMSLPATSIMLDPNMSVAGIAAAVVEVEPDRAESLIYQDRYPGLWLYADRRFAVLATPAELARALRDGRWVVIEERDLEKLPDEVLSLVGDTRQYRHKRRVVLLVRAAGSGSE